MELDVRIAVLSKSLNVAVDRERHLILKGVQLGLNVFDKLSVGCFSSAKGSECDKPTETKRQTARLNSESRKYERDSEKHWTLSHYNVPSFYHNGHTPLNEQVGSALFSFRFSFVFFWRFFFFYF